MDNMKKARKGLEFSIITIEEDRLQQAIQLIVDVYDILEEMVKQLFSRIIVEPSPHLAQAFSFRWMISDIDRQ